jgi:tetratricopeptide (TPR) repeat protein
MLVLFGKPDNAVRFAVAYHRALAMLAVPLRARVAVHAGALTLRENSVADVALGAKQLEIDGVAKSVAARVMAMAAGGQSLLTEAVRAELAEMAEQLQSHGHWRLKGIAEPLELFEVVDAGGVFQPPAGSDKAHAVRLSAGRWLPVQTVPNNLPHQLTAFIGRRLEVTHCENLLERSRLVTVTGSGGCGKTRLALQVAAEVSAGYEGGVWLAELASLASPDLVPQAVARAVTLKEEPGRDLTDLLLTHLENKQLLLVLDNAEHLLAACAQLADRILRHCPRVTLLVSSREGLGVSGELAYRIPSLAVPELERDHSAERLAQYESVALFVDRARSQQPAFKLDAANASTVASICHRLDGIPLAIELAAARLRSLSVQEIDQRIGKRFHFLTGGSRTALPRQQTLRSLIDWSYDLLTAPEQALFCRLAVFDGGWTLDTATQVCAGDRMLVANSLNNLGIIYIRRDENAVARELFEEVLAERRAIGDPWGIAASLNNLGVACRHDAIVQRRCYEESLAIYRSLGDQSGVAYALGNLSESAMRANDLDAASSLSDEALEIARHLEDGLDICKKLAQLGSIATKRRDHTQAKALFEESLALGRKFGEKLRIAMALYGLADVALATGHLKNAADLFSESLSLLRALGIPTLVRKSLTGLGRVAAEQGNLVMARGFLEEAAAIARELGLAADSEDVSRALDDLSQREGLTISK